MLVDAYISSVNSDRKLNSQTAPTIGECSIIIYLNVHAVVLLSFMNITYFSKVQDKETKAKGK